MTWHTTYDLDEFETATGDFVRADPVRNILLANIPGRLRLQGLGYYGDVPPRFGWFAEAGRIAAVLVQTPPHPVLLSALPAEAVDPFVDLALASGGVMAGFSAPVSTADAITAAWAGHTGQVARLCQQSRLFRLSALVPPDPMPAGAARVAGTADRDLLVHWFEVFGELMRGPRTDAARSADDGIARGSLLLWEVEGEPVSCVGTVAMGSGAASIGPVFTAEEHRRHGYAAAVTAEASRRAVGAGAAEVVLFTDVLNQTSNGVYERIGFVPVEERRIMVFAD